jgi:hypothetical protein
MSSSCAILSRQNSCHLSRRFKFWRPSATQAWSSSTTIRATTYYDYEAGSPLPSPKILLPTKQQQQKSSSRATCEHYTKSGKIFHSSIYQKTYNQLDYNQLQQSFGRMFSSMTQHHKHHHEKVFNNTNKTTNNIFIKRYRSTTTVATTTSVIEDVMDIDDRDELFSKEDVQLEEHKRRKLSDVCTQRKLTNSWFFCYFIIFGLLPIFYIYILFSLHLYII